jgi:hypothetical protein
VTPPPAIRPRPGVHPLEDVLNDVLRRPLIPGQDCRQPDKLKVMHAEQPVKVPLRGIRLAASRDGDGPAASNPHVL